MKLPPLVAFVLCSGIWGTSWLAIKIGYEGFDPLWGASLRFFVASLLMVPLVMHQRLPLPAGRRQVGVVVSVGLLLFGLDYGLIYWGEQFVPSGLAAILFATMPIFVALGAAGLIPSERMQPRQLVGVAVSLVGLALIFRDQLSIQSSVAGSVAIVVAAAAAGLSSVIVRRWGKDVPGATLNAGAMFVGATFLLAWALVAGERIAGPSTLNAALALMHLAVLASVVAFLLYWSLLRRWDANRASLIVLVMPVIAILAGAAYGETLRPWQWTGSVVVLLGVALSLYGLPRVSGLSNARALSKE